MATIDDVLKSGHLAIFELPDWGPRVPVRPLYVASQFFDWADTQSELHDMQFAVGGRLLFEHILQMLCEFRCADRVRYADLKRMMPTRKGIWHMYPPRLRVYGWCPEKHSLVVITGALEVATKQNRRLNDQKRDEVLDFARNHGLLQTIKLGDFLALFPN